MGVGAAILGGAAISGAFSYLGSREQSSAAQQAGNVQASSTREATQLEREMYYQNREDLAPWRAAGERSLRDLLTEQEVFANLVHDPSSFAKSPAYNFLLDEGIGAVQRAAGAKGKLDSGETLKDLVTFGQGLASTEYQNAINRENFLLNRYAGTAGVGQNAVNTGINAGQNYATNAGNLALAGGKFAADSIYNQANARTSLYSNLSNVANQGINNFLLYKALTPSS